jgi:hypothetical protein
LMDVALRLAARRVTARGAHAAVNAQPDATDPAGANQITRVNCTHCR